MAAALEAAVVFFVPYNYNSVLRHLERRLPVSGLERYPGCHPFAALRASSERSEGSFRPASQTLRCAQGDRPSLQMSTVSFASLTMPFPIVEDTRVDITTSGA